MGDGVTGGYRLVKFLLFVFNLLFWVFGIALIVVGAIALNKYGSIFTLASGQNWSSAPALVIAVGCIVFLVAFCGCFGAIRENKCFLYLFSVLLSVIFVLTLAGCILVAVFKNEIEDDLKKVMERSLQKYNNNNTGIMNAWRSLQRDWPKCCGVTNYTDWENNGITIPQSCCKHGSPCDVSDPTQLYPEGCFNKTVSAIEDHWPVAAGIAGGVAVIQLIGVFMSCGLARAIGASYEVV
ncbi:tetraspanin-9-like [Corticium candelabrum]|uniref:tetraspanin-9-like n=1 Tax=Corticium candelabrum TaxID=121492 RepID=UPI002E25DB45|nr:tetraspanin-9-like [Corticium candelabrum]